MLSNPPWRAASTQAGTSSGPWMRPRRFELGFRERLGADRQPVNARLAVGGQIVPFGRARIRFHRDLGGVAQERLEPRQELRQCTGGKKARRPAAEKHAVELRNGTWLPRVRPGTKLALQRTDVGVLLQAAGQRVGIEVAIRALLHAPRKVNVQPSSGASALVMVNGPPPRAVGRVASSSLKLLCADKVVK